MGTAVWIEKAHFRMSAAGEQAGVAAVKAAFPSEQVFLTKGINERAAAYREFSSATRLGGLVRALTGKDTDRLPEEKARGISIELGYAPLTLPSGRNVSVIDVPGHERFVRNMVAGATGIDCRA